ncbi:phage tail sheath C-terminal domain-containing protein [uncultured Thiodictyon sp.]|jgi:hypothetical protein|uniref:phage tail sheath C-terminal domain-containing protein n=1 Tax=uncultured Thiodictyon sp. TaxID=1846217 RepID=UPI0025D592CA|nr:phage tail sheath C-terminal domain-containing protein [uncultured Thiodictyon sp.]
MSALARLPLGAPGVYPYPGPALRSLTGVRLDLCAFAGVAPRGPARVPVVEDEADGHFWRGDVPWVEPQRPRRRTVAVPVESFEDYRRIFGGFEGPGRLPYAVAAYFDNGGRRALVARIVHDYGPGDPRNDQGVARALLAGVKPAIGLRARSEGSWGAAMTATLVFRASPVDLTPEAGGLRLGPGATLVAGALLRVSNGDGTRVLRFVSQLIEVPDGDRPVHKTLALTDSPLPPAAAGSMPRFEQVEGDLTLDDGDGRREQHTGLGLAFGHPRWLAQVLCDASSLAWPEPDWARAQVEPLDADLRPPPTARFDAGGDLTDRWADLDHEDFFDAGWAPESGEPGNGICCFAGPPDAAGNAGLRPASLVVPDLYSHRPLIVAEPVAPVVTLAGAGFARCVRVDAPATQEPAANDLPGLHLDPLLDLDQILGLQQRLIGFAESLRDLVALLDVPPGLDPARIRRWRGALASSYAAAYHPWLAVARLDDARDALVEVPPAALAAGILADRELTFGVPHGPANQLAVGAVSALAALPPDLHGQLHQAGINCYVRDRDGLRLTGARTLSADPAYRQLSVRRLMILLRRVLLEQMQWAVFEPNGPALWREVRLLLDAYLRQLYQHGAFRGATEEEAWFVRCDEGLNPAYERDQGRMTAQVGVAPAEPLEFIVLHLTRTGDGVLSISE